MADNNYQQRRSKSEVHNAVLNSLKITISIKSLYARSFLASNFDNSSYVANVKTPSTCNARVIQEQ